MDETCRCRETSYFRDLGLLIPRGHDCAYTTARSALIPLAFARATLKAREGDVTCAFIEEMDALVGERLRKKAD